MIAVGAGVARLRPTTSPLAAEGIAADAIADVATAAVPVEPAAAAGTVGDLGSSDIAAAPLPTEPIPAAAPPVAPTGDSPLAELSATPHAWQPWSPNSGSFHVSATPDSTPLAARGGMWRLMSSVGSEGTGVSGVASTQVETPSVHTDATAAATTPDSPVAPPAASVSGSDPPPPTHTAPIGDSAPDGSGTATTGGSGTGPTGTGTVIGTGTVTGTAAATDTGTGSTGSGSGSTGGTGNPAVPHPNPLDGPSGGGFEPGGSAAPASGGGVAATPEPGSVILIGSGLLGILGLLRKRRLI